ncbi:hypothetical protein Tco_1298510, partial [Tanacetum coccineum]
KYEHVGPKFSEWRIEEKITSNSRKSEIKMKLSNLVIQVSKIEFLQKHKCRTFTIDANTCLLTRITSTIVVPPKKPISPTVVKKTLPNSNYSGKLKDITNIGTIIFGNEHVATTRGYGDYQIGNVMISQVYYVEGLGHNLFSVGKFYDSDLKVEFCKHTCFVHGLEGVDLLKGYRGSNLYTLSLEEMMQSSPICLLSKASKIESWLWH